MPRGEILDIWLDTATRKRKQETKGDHTGAGDDPAAGIPSVGALTLSLTLTLTLSLSLTLTTLTTLTLIVCVGQRGPRADLCQYCVIGWNNNLSKVLHGPVHQVPRAMRAALCVRSTGSPCTARAARALLNRRCVQHCNSEYMLSKLQWAARTVPVIQLWVVRVVSRQPAACTRRHAVTARLAEWRT